ncbi:DUF4430 domain-containing protein [Papillibacter cinnamivorans]|uniref:Transcobalamin-like C-terminal domain-containing protein n=1 Tax=Papillibacter cinnamivorans DSM 12816 TaxID=1122930 RepID=A0A1W2CY10_9FIRM|nr:DUF4430 domain-containing protein [Papillibacter cinnamivorans]SMC90145.1 protein of unknown function [Papillibacter cinnamivorans DSM 12816]
MSKKQILAAAAAALVILLAAFFWGGNYAAKSGTPETSAPAADAAATATLSVPGPSSSLSQPSSEVTSDPTVSPSAEPGGSPASPKPSNPTPAIDPAVSPSPSSQEPDEEKELFCTLSVSCGTILDNLESFSKDKLEILPEDGILFPTQTVQFYEGETVFNVLQREMKKHGIHMEFSSVPLYNSNYIEGIGNIYEFDCGELSGWVYRVNGKFPGYGCSQYALEDGDTVEWLYTCDQGKDVGGDNGAWEDTE